ncbi:alpha/beta hydrolase family protein [Herbiconiux liukaitaii]|uniref:alpha/beta hydrolase family protein n=1 Tax=Herbiconiux liukaitaii TaxID=3342799 RepID=UPI0035B86E82
MLAVGLLAASAVAAVVLPVWTMPTPTGDYAIGSVDLEFDDPDRPETHTADPDDTRRVMTTVWYPVDPDDAEGLTPQPYPSQLGAAVSSVFGLPDALLTHAELVSTHVVSGAEVASEADAYPVILFSPGVLSTRFQSMAMVEELVSRGFVVVGIDHPYTSGEVEFPDGSTAAAVDDITDTGSTTEEEYAYNVSEVGIRVADASFVLDRLTALNDDDPTGLLQGRLDLESVGIAGHSFGGATAVQALSVDERIDVGLSLEGGFWGSVTSTGLTKPFAYLASEATAEAFRTKDVAAGYTPELDADLRATLGTSTAELDAAVIDGFIHQSFTDLALVSPALFAGGMDPAHNVDITRTQASWFFEKHLHGDDSGDFGTDSPAYPEVEFADDPGALFG